MNATQQQQRFALLAATPANERSEIAAIFDHQLEADWLTATATATAVSDNLHHPLTAAAAKGGVS